MSRYTTAALAGLMLVFAAGAVDITIDPNTRFQTIEGFGAHGSMNVWWSSGPWYNDQFLTWVVDELGLTMNRNEFYPDYESTNDNGDPNTLGTFNSAAEFITKQRSWINALKAKAAASGETIRFIATYWSPPAWMKVNNSTVGGDAATNILRTGVEAELGELGVATVKAYKDQCNVDLYALSMQNESAFDEPYNSCVYSNTRYRDVFKVFGPRVHGTYPDVKLFGAEHMLSNWGYFEGTLMADTLARRHVDAFAVHGYSDGVHPQPSSNAATLWRRAYNNVRTTGKSLWMTETSGFSNDWAGAQGTVDAIFAALKYGHVNAWVWWQLSGNHTAGELLMPGIARGKLFYAAKQYFRYIRPGALGIKSESNDTGVAVVGFHHVQNQTLTLVLLNWSSTTKSISFVGNPVPQFTAYRTSSGEDCANVGTVNGSTTLPAGSITTLFGQNYNPVTAVDGPAAARPVSLARSAGATVYALDGRLLTSRLRPADLAPGAYVAVTKNTHGTLQHAVLKAR